MFCVAICPFNFASLFIQCSGCVIAYYTAALMVRLGNNFGELWTCTFDMEPGLLQREQTSMLYFSKPSWFFVEFHRQCTSARGWEKHKGLHASLWDMSLEHQSALLVLKFRGSQQSVNMGDALYHDPADWWNMGKTIHICKRFYEK